MTVKRMHSKPVIHFTVRLSEHGRKCFTGQSRYSKDHHTRLGTVDRENSDQTQWRVTWEGCKSGQWYDKRFLECVEPGVSVSRVPGFYWIRWSYASRWGIGMWTGSVWCPVILDWNGLWVGSNPIAVSLSDADLHEIGGMLHAPAVLPT